MQTRIVPYLLVLGTPDFPRFVVAEKGGRVWDGSKWTTDEANGILFANATEAALLCQAHQRNAFADKLCVDQFTVPLRIEAHSDSGINLAQLEAWLKRAVNLQVCYLKNGNGPDDSLVLLNISWNEIERDDTAHSNN